MVTQTPSTSPEQFVVTYDLTGTFMLPKKFNIRKIEGLVRAEIYENKGAYLTVFCVWRNQGDYQKRGRRFMEMARIPAGAGSSEGRFYKGFYADRTFGKMLLKLGWWVWLLAVHAGAGWALYQHFTR